jgi:hypothetical protein
LEKRTGKGSCRGKRSPRYVAESPGEHDTIATPAPPPHRAQAQILGSVQGAPVTLGDARDRRHGTGLAPHVRELYEEWCLSLEDGRQLRWAHLHLVDETLATDTTRDTNSPME